MKNVFGSRASTLFRFNVDSKKAAFKGGFLTVGGVCFRLARRETLRRHAKEKTPII